jgi:hypothetical protein
MRVDYTGTIHSILRSSRFIDGYYHRYYPPTGPSRFVWEIRVKDNTQPIDKPTSPRKVYKWFNGMFCREYAYGYYKYENGDYVWVFLYNYWSPV